MKIKAVDIARTLGVSKATVSLALNNKPGVSENTKQEILDCLEKMKKGNADEDQVPNKNQFIQVIIANKGLKMVCNSELDLWTDVLSVFDSEAKRLGYSVSVTYVDMLNCDVSSAIEECNQELVAGVILEAAELQAEDWKLFGKIEKPMVIYDNDFEDGSCYSVVADNRGGIKIAMEYLYSRNKRQILYLANEIEIYNFLQRRKEYREFLYEHNIEQDGNKIIPIGTTINSVYKNMLNYMDHNKLPQAIVMENYQVSIGVMRAFRERNISVPEDLSLIGFDEIPSYVTGDCQLTTIRIPHTDRARMVLHLLQREIMQRDEVKSVVMSKCKLIEGNSVG